MKSTWWYIDLRKSVEEQEESQNVVSFISTISTPLTPNPSYFVRAQVCKRPRSTELNIKPVVEGRK